MNKELMTWLDSLLQEVEGIEVRRKSSRRLRVDVDADGSYTPGLDLPLAGVDFTLVNYPGVKHSFTNPDADRFGEQFDMPLAYDAGADADSWTRLQEFLKAIFSR